MTAKQKAVAITDNLILQSMALEKVLFHENEADRYRRQLRRIGDEIRRLAKEPETVESLVVNTSSKK